MTVQNYTGPDPNLTFDSFIIRPENNLAYECARTVAQRFSSDYNPLFITGGTSNERVHLVQAIGNYYARGHKAGILYVSAEAFIKEYSDALRTSKVRRFRTKYKSPDLFLMTEVDCFAASIRAQEEFLELFNFLYDVRRQMVLTGSDMPECTSGLHERLASRFVWGCVAEIT